MNELRDIIEFVAAWPPFDQLEDAPLSALCCQAEITYHRAGEVILACNAENSELMLVRRGAVGIHTEAGDFLEKRAEGAVFGYPALITGRPTRFEVRAAEDTLLYRFPEPAFRAARAASAAFDRYFSLALVDRVQQALDQRSELTLASTTIGDLMSSPPVLVGADTPIQAAAARMSERRISSLLVSFPEGRYAILTDRDLRSRVVAAGTEAARPVGDIATRDLVTISPQETLLDAMLLMADRDLHHLPVFSDGKPVGMLTASDVTRADNSQPVFYVRAIRRAKTLQAVADAARRRGELFVNLVRMDLRAAHVGQIMAGITDAVTQRCIELAIAQLGDPPLPFAWLAFGSQARREQTARTDQDNGLLLADIPEGSANQWFAEFAKVVCRGLDSAGIVKCPGDVMATNGKWRQPLSVWRRHFSGWIDEPDPKPLMYASIFFDLRCVGGDKTLAAKLGEHIFERAMDNRLFLRFMAHNALAHSPPLGFFRRFILEPDGQHSEGLNLKQRGVVPITALAQVRALEHGVSAPGTLERLAELAELRPNAARDLANLADAWELIERFRITHQADQLAAGELPTNFVDPDRLSALARDHLRAAFEAVRTAQRILERRYLLG